MKTENANNPVLGMAVVAVAAFLIYSAVLTAGFVWDDAILVVNNLYIRQPGHLIDILTQDVAQGAGQRYYFYRPLQNLSYLIDYRVFGLNPWGFHLVNLLLHLAAGCGVFAFVRRVAKNDAVALLSSAFFLWHPIHTSVVCYIASRADLLCAVFMTWSAWSYVRAIQQKGWFFSGLAAALYALALFSKESAIVLPVLLWPVHALLKIPLTRKDWGWPALTALGYIVWRLIGVPQVLSPSIYHVPLADKIPGAFAALREDVRLLLLPSDLHMHYGNVLFAWQDPFVLQGLVLCLAMFILMVAAFRRAPLIAFGEGWFLMALVPVTVFPLNAFMAESWLYVPSVGFAIVAACVVQSVKMRPLALVVTGALLAFYALGVIGQTQHWQNNLTLFQHTAKYSPSSAKIFYNLGNAYRQRGQTQQAMVCYQKALALNPQIIEAKTALQQLGAH